MSHLTRCGEIMEPAFCSPHNFDRPCSPLSKAVAWQETECKEQISEKATTIRCTFQNEHDLSLHVEMIGLALQRIMSEQTDDANLQPAKRLGSQASCARDTIQQILHEDLSTPDALGTRMPPLDPSSGLIASDFADLAHVSSEVCSYLVRVTDAWIQAYISKPCTSDEHAGREQSSQTSLGHVSRRGRPIDEQIIGSRFDEGETMHERAESRHHSAGKISDASVRD